MLSTVITGRTDTPLSSAPTSFFSSSGSCFKGFTDSQRRLASFRPMKGNGFEQGLLRLQEFVPLRGTAAHGLLHRCRLTVGLLPFIFVEGGPDAPLRGVCSKKFRQVD